MTTKELSEQEIKPVARVTCDGVMGVSFTEHCNYGCDLKIGEILYSESTVTALRAEIERLKEAAQVPGKMKCAKCDFVLIRNVLNVGDGHVYAAENSPEICPNGCGNMWPITWEMEAQDGYKALDKLFNRAVEAEEKLKEKAEPAQIDERAAFEKFMSGQLFPDSYFFKSPLTNLYVNETIQSYWLGWQARAQLERGGK